MEWLAGYKNRKKITLSGQPGAGTNYQVLLKIGESSTAQGYDFHIDGHAKNFPVSKNDGGDLAFTLSDGITELPFWVENVSGNVGSRIADVWIKVADNLDNNVDIYCYYNNQNAINKSNGDNTFILFDDFDNISLDTNKWGFPTGNYYNISNSIFTITGVSGKYTNFFSKNQFGLGTRVFFGNARLSSTIVGYHYIGMLKKYDGSTWGAETPWRAFATSWDYTGNRQRYMLSSSSSRVWTEQSGNFVNVDRRLEIRAKPNGITEWVQDGFIIRTVSGFSSELSGVFASYYKDNSGSQTKWDFIAVAKIANNDVTINMVGSEETQKSIYKINII